MYEMLKIDGRSRFPVDGRELHGALKIGAEYSHWFRRMCEYGFSEKVDYEVFVKNDDNPKGGRPSVNHAVTLSMAKEICMIQRTDEGRKIRQYLIGVEEAWNKPELVMARALQMASAMLDESRSRVVALETENRLLSEQVLQWDARAFVNAAVRRYSLTRMGSNAEKFAYAWTAYKKELLYRHGININRRITEYHNRTGKRTAPKTLEMLGEDEMPKAVSTITALCRESGVDIADLLKNIDNVLPLPA